MTDDISTLCHGPVAPSRHRRNTLVKRRRTPTDTSPMEPVARTDSTPPAAAAWLRRAVAAVVMALGSFAVTTAGPAPVVVQAATACPNSSYTVVSGDSWSVIAGRHKVTLASLLGANQATTSTMIHPGQQLCLPANATLPSSTTSTTKPTSTTQPTTTTKPTSTTQPTTTTRPKPVAVTLARFPVQGPCWFTDTWGAPRSGGRTHEGVDIIAKANQYVYAATEGTLTKKYIDRPGALAGNGWRLTSSDGTGTYFFYAHFSAFAPGLDIGSKVVAGQIIGFIGMTGSAGTPHLHFEVHPGGGAAINPTPTVKAVDGCKSSTVPPQPGGVIPTLPSPTTPTTVPPTTTAPPTTVPGNTAPTSPTTAPTSTTPIPTTAPSAVPTTSVPSGPATSWRFIAPVTAFDSSGTRLAAATPRSITVSGLAGVPTTVPAVMVRVVARNVAAGGHVTVHPCGATPSGITMAIAPARINATVTTVALSKGQLCVTSSVRTDVRVEVIAVLTAGGVGVEPTVARRALDTRPGDPMAANSTKGLSPKALGTPLGSSAVTVTVTVIGPSADGSIGIGACGGTPWIVPFRAAPVQTFSGVVRTNDAGVCLSTSVATDVVVDVTGVWRGTTATSAAGPSRAFDSRRSGPIGTNPTAVTLAGVGASAKSAQLSVTVLGGARGGAVYVWPCASARPAAAVAVTAAGQNSTATVSAALSGGSLCVATTSSLHVVIDVAATS
jgi:murein DD-endopeptidase MepM/ murein hydrolase activator NlpD